MKMTRNVKHVKARGRAVYIHVCRRVGADVNVTFGLFTGGSGFAFSDNLN